jgi:hypothetical protein
MIAQQGAGSSTTTTVLFTSTPSGKFTATQCTLSSADGTETCRTNYTPVAAAKVTEAAPRAALDELGGPERTATLVLSR